ncbi:copine-9-like [Contarinia nasturtii]|uniref:copine-9-like n=1 Tax=Contarinia nasturtii TaxID=265458 RepID=UPI0012D492B7|nr:copine-9-like [Contarinia nasturtii]
MNEILEPFLSNSTPTSQLELTISARNLLNTDILSKSDPFCIISMREEPWQDQYYEIAKTEMIADTLNPQWVRKVVVNYSFESIQRIRFEIRDEDVTLSDFLGYYETTLSDLISYTGRQYIRKLKGMREAKQVDCGQIIIVTEELSSCKQMVEIQFKATNLPKLNPIIRNDPFLVISRSNLYGDSYSVVTKTDPVRSTQNPTFKPISIRIASLCNGDFDRDIKIECYDYRSNGNHYLIGTCYATLKSLSAHDEPPMTLVNEQRLRIQASRCAVGQLFVEKIHIDEEITFLEYLRNGTQMHFAVAIDFTGSNGVHIDPNSLHYLCDERMNSYEIALTGVGQILQHYDSTKKLLAYGFGAKIPPSYKISHLFALNGNSENPYCSDIDEILQNYWQQLNTVQLSGPTFFSPIINSVISIAKDFQDGKHYYVLLIITDGIISDIQRTKQAIVKASSLPISIIIVGVGNADFKKMFKLDGDSVRLNAKGREAERDIVQFVPLEKYIARSGLNQHIKSQADLAKEVLAEIPEQLTSYMKSRGIKPTIVARSTPDSLLAVTPTMSSV